jgi:hypothetical protein
MRSYSGRTHSDTEEKPGGPFGMKKLSASRLHGNERTAALNLLETNEMD